jgi:hypothetical protein
MVIDSEVPMADLSRVRPELAPMIVCIVSYIPWVSVTFTVCEAPSEKTVPFWLMAASAITAYRGRTDDNVFIIVMSLLKKVHPIDVFEALPKEIERMDALGVVDGETREAGIGRPRDEGRTDIEYEVIAAGVLLCWQAEKTRARALRANAKENIFFIINSCRLHRFRMPRLCRFYIRI